MIPMYMNSSQRSQVRPQGHYHQGFGNHPHHVTMDDSSPESCEHWAAPSPCYGSFVHGNFPAYNAYWSPCCPPQVPFHPCSMNYYGFHPHASHAPPCYLHQPFPAGYQPWFGSDRDAPGKHHCAKCSPQVCYPKTDRGVVIEEHDPEGDHGVAAKPAHPTRCPYPVVWIPHEDARNQEYGGSPESGSHERSSSEVKGPGCTEVQKSDPKSWNGCLPLDENTIKSLIQNLDRRETMNGNTVKLPFDISKLKKFLLPGQEGKEVQTQKNKEPGQLSYPVFWIPSHGKQEEVTAAENRERSNEAPNSNLKSIPSDLHANEGQIIQHKGKEGDIECKDAEEKSSMRNIPVENLQMGPRNIPVELLESNLPKPVEPTKNITKTEPVENKEKDQRSSPPKASRLPPVCLRVDPLPKRKNGGSNSPSPPRRNGQRLTSEETKVASPPNSKKVETRPAAEPHNVKSEEINKENMMSESRLTAAATEKESVESKPNLQGANSEIVEHFETKENTEKLARKTFTEDEAARIIQSWYRGYDVRRWEPLKKLKEIATIREQMGDVKKRVQGLEISSGQRIEEKEIVILGEVVMNLLLKVDSVQGLHPSIKDHRKSLARELSGIQEKLDSMRKSSSIAEEEAIKEQVEITSETGVSPADMDHPHLTVENKMVMHPDTEKVSPEENPLSGTDEKLAPVAEEGSGSESFETLGMKLEPAIDAGTYEAVPTLTTVPEKDGEVETVLPDNLQSADGDGMCEEDRAVVESLEELPHKLPQVVTGLNATEVSEAEANAMSEEDKVVVESLEELSDELPLVVAGLNATEVSEADANAMSEEYKAAVESLEELPHESPQVVAEPNASEVEAKASENEDLKGDEDTVLPLERDVELLELPIGVIDDGVQALPQDSSSCSSEEKPMDPEAEASALENLDRKEEDDTILPTEIDVEISEQPAGVFGDEMQLLSQDSSACIDEMKKTATDAETTNQEESDSHHSSGNSKDIGQTSNEPQEDKEQPVEESEVTELPDEAKRLMEVRDGDHSSDDSKAIGQESCEPQEDKEQPKEESEVKEHEVPEEAKRLMEENQRYKEMMETLVKAGREQLEVISKLTGRVKSLEKKLSQKKRTQIGRRKACRGKQVIKPMSTDATYAVLL